MPVYEWEKNRPPKDIWGNTHFPEQRLEMRLSLYDNVWDAAAFRAVAVAHKMCEQEQEADPASH